MMDRGVTGLLLDAIAKLETIDVFGGVIADYHNAWSIDGCSLYSILDNKDNLQMLVDYLKVEYHAGRKIDPQIQKLRELLESAEKIADKVRPDTGVPAELRHNFIMLGYKCNDWIGWIDQYFPPEQPNQEQDYMEPAKQVNKPKRMTAAAKKLATPELQEVKLKLVDAGLIVNGQWVASVAEFECLVKELGKAEYDGGFGINTDKGNLARKECANFVGFTGDLESARSNTYHEQHSPNANLIKNICRGIKTKYVK